MGIYRKGKEITAIHRKGRDTSEVWKFIGGAWTAVWQFVRSCFGKGYWLNELPWRNDDVWKNN